MKPRSFTPLCEMPRSSRRATACRKVTRETEKAMWWTLPWSRDVGVRVGFSRLVGEDGDQPPVAGIEIEVALGRDVEVRLLEDERHAEHALPEIDRGLPVGADQGDVVHALRLQLLHGCPPRRLAAGLHVAAY